MIGQNFLAGMAELADALDLKRPETFGRCREVKEISPNASVLDVIGRSRNREQRLT